MGNNKLEMTSNKRGEIMVDGERMILTSPSVFGTLVKDLSENISESRMKGFMIRYGWNLGVNDAKKMKKNHKLSLENHLKKGPTLHMMRGYTEVVRTHFSIDYNSDQSVQCIHVEGKWLNSYEAEEYIKQFGCSNSPVCHTLVGYASGYYSEICQKSVYFKEVSCKGMGDSHCSYVGKTLQEWGEDIKEELRYYQDQAIVKELEKTYKQLIEEQNIISRSFHIHKLLTDELANGSDLQDMASVVHNETKVPLLIEDVHFNPIAYSGIQEDRLLEIYEHEIVEKYDQTEIIETRSHCRMVTPIYLKEQLLGYCSFIQEDQVQLSKADQMILERVATVCSLYLLNEKNAFEATERVKGQFLEQIISGQALTKQEILKRGSFISIDLSKPFQIAILKYSNIQTAEEHDLLLNDRLISWVRDYFKKSKDILIGQKGSEIIVLVQSEPYEKFSSLISYLKQAEPELSYSIGISTIDNQIEQASHLYHEAKVALQMTKGHNKVTEFDELGVIGLLLDSSNKDAVRFKAKQLLDPIYHAEHHSSELLKTLYVFLSNGGNLEQTMRDLSLSLSGLRYRVKRIEQLTGHNLRNPEITHQLYITLQFLISEGELEL